MSPSQVAAWLAGRAEPLGPRGAGLARLADALAGADVVGIGVTTREGADTFAVQRTMLQELVGRGTRTLVLQDTTEVGDDLDSWVTGGPGSATDALSRAWGPWRTQEVAAALTWVRDRNSRHPDDLVRVIGLTRPSAGPADHDVVLEHATARLPAARAERLRTLLTTIRVAHDGGEHVERAHGRYDGPPFVDLAREARQILAEVPDVEPAPLAAMDLIVEHHATSLSQGRDPRSQGPEMADRIVERLARSGRPLVVWDGISHLLPVAPAVGHHLRERLGRDYQVVGVTFGTGHVRDVTLPPPAAGSLEALLEEVGREAFTVAVEERDAPSEVTALWHAPTRLRIVSGMYRPEQDEQHYTPIPSIAGTVDHLVHLPTITPAHALGPRTGSH